VVSVDQTPEMINDEGWAHGFYGLTDANSGTFFAECVPPSGRGAPLNTAAIARLVERAGPAAVPGNLRPETLPSCATTPSRTGATSSPAPTCRC
jgi:non-heme chloroperoxidase